jgi:hypothetical protein
MDWDDEPMVRITQPDYKFLTQQFLNCITFADWYRTNNWDTLAERVEESLDNQLLEEIWAMRMEITRQCNEYIEYYENIEEYETCALLKAKERSLRHDALMVEMKLESFVYYNKK